MHVPYAAAPPASLTPCARSVGDPVSVCVVADEVQPAGVMNGPLRLVDAPTAWPVFSPDPLCRSGHSQASAMRVNPGVPVGVPEADD